MEQFEVADHLKKIEHYSLLSKSKEYSLQGVVSKKGKKLYAKFPEWSWSTDLKQERIAVWEYDAMILRQFLENLKLAVIPRYTEFQSLYKFSKYLWDIY